MMAQPAAGRSGRTLLGVALLCAGCALESSFPINKQGVAPPNRPGPAASGADPRIWVRSAAQRLAPLLPASDQMVLLAEDLVGPGGRAARVHAHFGLQSWALRIPWFNYYGLLHSGLSVARGVAHEAAPPPWVSFEEVWIPITGDLRLAARLGRVKHNNAVDDADCIVILPGFLGDNGVQRTRDLSLGLLSMGFHVLAVEPRGQGQSDVAQPNVASTMGILETADLLRIDEWLHALPQVRRVGLIGFCWGANMALLAAWYDGLAASGTKAIVNDPDVRPLISRHMPEVSAARHFDAGVIAFSPVLRFEEIIARLESPQTLVSNLALAPLQETVRQRTARKGCFETGSLRTLIEVELQRSELRDPDVLEAALRFVRFLPYQEKPVTDKLNLARTPILIVAAANDPFTSAQDVADLFAGIGVSKYRPSQAPHGASGTAPLINPCVAALVLPGGGHCGFAPYARDFYYSLIAAFFADGRSVSR